MGFGLGVDLGLYRRRGGGASAYTPAALFAASEDGAWYDPSDLSTLWQDTAGTVPVTADGQSVARIDDKSGNGHHITQTTSSIRPVYKTSGGLHWLLFDGVDDTFQSATSVLVEAAAGVTVVSGLQLAATPAAGLSGMFGFGEAALPRVQIVTQTSERAHFYARKTAGDFDQTVASAVGSLPVGTSKVVSGTLSSTSIDLWINQVNSTNTVPDVADLSETVKPCIVIGGNVNLNFYGGVVIADGKTTEERESAESHFAEKAGVTL